MVDMFSWTSHRTFEESHRTQKAPYLTLTIIDSSNLIQLLDADTIDPYINLRLGEDTWESQLGKETSIGRHFWGEIFEIEITGPHPLYLIIYDKEDYGDDNLVSTLQFNPKIFEGWKGKKEIWLRLQQPRESVTGEIDPEEEAVNVTNSILGSPYDKCPLLHIEIEYMDSETLNKIQVSVGSHRNIVKNREYFTVYEVWVNRNDGNNWRVKVRYSEIYSLREEMLHILPELSEIEFPGKTYFHWMRCICRRSSKFDEGLIERRKRGIEEFLNGVLDNESEIQSQTLNKLLEISAEEVKIRKICGYIKTLFF